jgi:hypothetical protein
VGEQVEQQARSTSKSAVSRQFVARTRENLEALMHRRLDDVRLAVLMVDGIDLKGRTIVVALGVTTDGVKIPLGLWEGSTENAAVATALLSDLIERGLDIEQGVLQIFGSRRGSGVMARLPWPLTRNGRRLLCWPGRRWSGAAAPSRDSRRGRIPQARR